MLIIQNFSEKPNTFSYACSELRMEYSPMQKRPCAAKGSRSGPRMRARAPVYGGLRRPFMAQGRFQKSRTRKLV